LLWNEVVYLYNNYDEQDNAIKTMITHSPTAFKHELFLQIIQKCNNSSVFYDSITFYLEEEPEKLNELLKVITNKVNLSKVVDLVSPSLTPDPKSRLLANHRRMAPNGPIQEQPIRQRRP
jgi:clathrin heavy chain